MIVEIRDSTPCASGNLSISKFNSPSPSPSHLRHEAVDLCGIEQSKSSSGNFATQEARRGICSEFWSEYLESICRVARPLESGSSDFVRCIFTSFRPRRMMNIAYFSSKIEFLTEIKVFILLWCMQRGKIE